MPNEIEISGFTDEMRAELLGAMGEQIRMPQRLPRIKIMAQGVGRFEFTDTNDTPQEFDGIIINSHPRNVLWDRPFEAAASVPEDQQGPACASPDGAIGVPRPGYEHHGLNGREATGAERISCDACPYNQWESKASLLGGTGRGKACTNQRSVYVVVEGTQSPYELILSPTSMSSLDAYLTSLLNQGIPVQVVGTHFSQEIKTRGALRWGVCKFESAGQVDDDTFRHVMNIRRDFANQINPTPPAISGEILEAEVVPEGNDQEDIPF
jgi:hypothetical protein